MLIGIDASRAVAERRTGTEVYSLSVIRELLRLDNVNRYRLYCRDVPAIPLDSCGEKVEGVSIGIPRLWTHVGLSWEVVKSPPSVLFIPAHVVPAVRRCPTVVTIHDVGYLDYPQAYRRTRWWYLHLSTLFSTRVATSIIADSQATKSDLIRRYKVQPDKIVVVHLGCDDIFAPVESSEVISATKTRCGIQGEYFLYLGTLQPRKNVLGLLRAFGQFKAQGGSGYKLVLAGGKGWLYEPIYRAVGELGLTDEVIFAGYVPEADLPALISGAVALVFPSFHEGFGLPALQAMACGTPVIASDVSSLPEVVGDAGLLLDPNDIGGWARGMAEVASDERLRQGMRERGIVRASALSWERCARETLRVLEEAGSER